MKKNLNIGFFTDTFVPQINGVVTSVQIIQKELEKKGNKVYVFAPSPKTIEDNINVFRLPSVKFIFQPEMRVSLPYSWKIDRKLKSLNLDIVHAHTPFGLGFFGKYTAQRLKIPFLQTFHTLYPEYLHYVLGPMGKTILAKYGAKKLIKALYGSSDIIVSPSLKIKDYLEGECQIKKPIKVISTGIDIESFKRVDQNIFRQQSDLDKKDKILLFVGRLGREKNIDFLIKALSFIKDKNTKLLIVGDGLEKENLKKLTKELSLEERVIFLGYISRKKIPFVFASSDIFVFASKTETQGLVLIEAAVSKKPIVALSDLVVQEFVKNNRNGFVIKENPKTFAQAIEKLLKDNKLSKKFSQNSFKIAQSFSLESQTEKLVELYDKLKS